MFNNTMNKSQFWKMLVFTLLKNQIETDGIFEICSRENSLSDYNFKKNFLLYHFAMWKAIGSL